MKTWLILFLTLCRAARADDLTSLCADRAAIERVYYNHRLGQKPPFEQVSPPSLIERLVNEDLRKEAALKNVYHVSITEAMLAAEVQRINTTTRAPEMLAEIKTALANDPVKFADAFAKPILVERELRHRFDNDDALHLPQRRDMESARAQLISAAAEFRKSRGNEALSSKSKIENQKSKIDEAAASKSEVRSQKSEIGGDLAGNLLALLKQAHSNAVSETTWQLGPRPEEKPAAQTSDELEIKKRFGPDAQVISSPHGGPDKERKLYFEDLPAELQSVLRVQLRQAGDVSAVIETPGGFLLYLAEARTPQTLTVAVLSLPKRSYEQWLEGQTK